jgi:ATP-dependent helicase HrpB
MQLPVDEIRPEFDARYATQTRPLIVTAPTGSGKSTRLPLWMRDGCTSPQGRVLVIEPRRVACRALATFLAKQAGEKVGESIGYNVRFENVQGKHTRVLFATPGVALRMLSAPELGFESVLIDEFHERGWEVDLVAAIIRKRRAEGASLKFVVTSATLDAEHLQAAMDADLLEASGRTFPVDVEYQGSASGPSSQDLEQRVERAVRRALDDGGDGEVLVFLPGKGEIGACANQLAGLERGKGVEVLQVHASLPMNKLMRAFEDPKPGVRRVFLATNVAETSVTLPGVTWVVDTGLVRMQVHRAGKTALSLLPTSMASMDQRAGRAGRVRPGTCIRLWAQTFRPSATTAPEIERVELDDLVLRAAICGLDITRLEQMPWVSAPPEFAVAQARARLVALGALDARGELTPLGEELLGLPVSSDSARLLVDAPPHLLGALCDLVALMQRGYRLMSRLDHLSGDQLEKVMTQRKELLEGITDEVYEALTVLRRGDARTHHLHRVGLQETRKIASSLRSMMRCKARSPDRDVQPLPDPEVLAAHVLSRAPQMGFVLRERAQRARPGKGRRSSTQPWANGEVELGVAPFKPIDAVNMPHYKPPTAGVICDHTWLGDSKGYGARGRGSLLLPCSHKTLALHVRGELEVGKIELKRGRAGRVKISAPIVKTLAGVTLSSEHEALTGEALRVAVATLTLENRLFKGAREQLRDCLHVLGILSQWAETLETQHWKLERLHALEPMVKPEHEWLVGRLEELGLESCEELELLEAEDLMPELVALTGVYLVEIDALLEDFPRVWECQGAPYICQVYPRQRKVEITPANKTAKQAKEPPANMLPRFQGFRVMYRQASRVVTLRG